MKHIKLTFTFAIIIMLVSLFTNNSVKAEDLDPCYPESPDKQCTDWTFYGFDMTYLGCPVHVDYLVRMCTITSPDCNNGNPHIRIETKIYRISWDDDCYIQTIMFPGWPNNFSDINYVQFGVLFSQASSKMAEVAFENFFNTLSSEQQNEYICAGTPPNCSNPSLNDFCEADVYYSNFTCQYICYYFKDAGTSGQGPGVITMTHPCTSENSTCCVHYVKFCKCGEQTFKTTFVDGSGLCQGAFPPTENPCFDISGYTSYTSQGCTTICQ